MKKTIIGVCTTLLIAVFMTGCSNDDDSDLSSVERSLVGCWQVVEHFNYSHQLLCLQLEKLPLSAEHALEKVSFC